MHTKLWTKYFQQRQTAKARVFCLPHAGGVAESFLPWKRLLPEWIDLCPIQLPGRSYRINEPTPETIHELARIVKDIIHVYSDLPYALFGHSMGSILAYEAAMLLPNKPQVLILSGGEPPHFWGHSPPIHHLSDQELITALTEKGSYDELTIQVMKKEGSAFLKALRSDLKLCSEYRYNENTLYEEKTIIAYALDDDLCPADLIHLWEQYCSVIEWISFETGGHFFIKEHANELIGSIIKALSPIVE